MVLSRDEALAFLSSSLDAPRVREGLERADARARAVAGGRGKIWASIGVDSMPCSRNCIFCSHGARWNSYRDERELDVGAIRELVARIAPQRPDWLTLRTTQDYPVERLCELAREVRSVLPTSTSIVVNTGELTVREAEALVFAGVRGAYHSFRLREGIDTGISPQERTRGLEAIRDSGLELYALVEPIGPEHSDEELVEAAFRLKDYGVRLSGAMARVPVPGTPSASMGQVERSRVARTVAMTRLISGPEVDAICVHPPVPDALRAGANVVVVDAGATPRDTHDAGAAWKGFDIPAARAVLAKAGWSVEGGQREAA